MRKRYDFLKRAAELVGADNVEVVWTRAEEGGQNKELRQVRCGELRQVRSKQVRVEGLRGDWSVYVICWSMLCSWIGLYVVQYWALNVVQ